eukprot:gene9636-12974_t
MFKLGFNTHGKGRVRLVKVTRGENDVHVVEQYNVQLLLEGDTMEEVFLTGDNKKVVPTDTCKNTVYCLANNHSFSSTEEFGIIICRHFLTEYPTLVNKICVQIIKDDWHRLTIPNSKGKAAPHRHAFRRFGPTVTYAHVQGEKKIGTAIKLSVQGGIRNLELLKTTQSGFVDFHRDRYTTLPEVADRLLGTSMEAEWEYNASLVNHNRLDFAKAAKIIETALISEFTGPSDTGVYSKSVQQTLYDMAVAALKKENTITKITLQMPNIHNIPFPLQQYGFENKDKTGLPTIFFPIDEPHGMIKATVTRPTAKL